MNRLLLPIFLLVAFLAYRLHFWDYEFEWHIVFNSIADIAFSIPCGIIIFQLSKKYSSHSLVFASLGIMIVSTYLLFLVHKIVYQYYHVFDNGFEMMFNTLCYQLLDSFSIIITGSLVYLLSLISNEKDVISKNLEEMAIAKEKEELKYLKTKLNPHFIFNGLNSIYHEIDHDKSFAKDRLIQFSDIVRYHLQYASQERVSFEVELSYLKSFIEFQYQSTSDFLRLKQAYQIEDKNTEIAPLLFIPFIENAFKYCSSPLNKKGKIEVNIQFNKKLLLMNVMNTYDPEYRKSKPSNGVGLKNVKKRLELHYAGKYELTVDDIYQNNIYNCQLKIAI